MSTQAYARSSSRPVALAVGFVSALAIGSLVGPSPAAEVETTSKQVPVVASPDSNMGLLERIDEARKHWPGRHDQKCVVAPMLVMVADPVRTGLEWAHDEHVKAVRRAFEHAGFTLVQHATPWHAVDGSPTAANHSMPGMLLFYSADRDQISPVFLVAESPTAGITGRELIALRSAVGLCLTLDPSRLRVVGPCFSGSRRQLMQLIQGCFYTGLTHDTGAWSLPTEVDWINGSATVQTLIQDIRGVALESAFLKLNVESTIMNDGDYAAAIQVLVSDLGLKPGECAVVAEASTQYGQSGASGLARFHGFTFPSHLARVRGDYADRWRREHATSTGNATELGLQEVDNTKLSPAPLSTLADAVVDQRLTAIMQAMRDRGTKLVVLLATDIRDKILLAREISRQVPDAQIVTTESHVLYLRKELSRAQRGMLVVGSALLVQETADPGSEGRTKTVAFASDAECGIHAAVLRHIDRFLPDGSGSKGKLEATHHPSLGKGVWVSCVGASRMLPVAFYCPKSDMWAAPERVTWPSADYDARVKFAVAALALFLSWLTRVLIRRHPVNPRLRVGIGRQHPCNEGAGALLTVASRATQSWLVWVILAVLAIQFASAGYLAAGSGNAATHTALSLVVLAFGLTCVGWVRLVWRRGLPMDLLAMPSLRLGGHPGDLVRSFARGLRWVGILALHLLLLVLLVLLAGSGIAVLEPGRMAKERVIYIEEWVSPVLPSVGLGLALVGWLVMQLRQAWHCRSVLPYELALSQPLALVKESKAIVDDSSARRSSEDWRQWEAAAKGSPLRARWLLLGLWSSHPISLIGVAVCGVVVVGAMKEHSTIESIAAPIDPFGAYYRFGLVFLLCAVVLGCARVLEIWNIFVAHTKDFDGPMMDAMRRAGDRRDPVVDTDLVVPPQKTKRSEVRESIERLRGWVDKSEFWSPSIEDAARSPNGARGRAALLVAVLRTFGRGRRGVIELRAEVAPEVVDFVAEEFFAWLRWLVSQLHRLAVRLMALVVGISLLMWSYPLYPRSPHAVAYLVAAITLVGVLCYLAFAMSANRVLSVLTKTEPGHITVNRAFVNTFVVYVVLPSVMFLAAQMPELGGRVLAWLKPILSVAATR